MIVATEQAAQALADLERASGVALGNTWQQRLESLANLGLLRGAGTATMAASVVRKVNAFVHETRAAAAGSGVFRMLNAGDELVHDSDAEADSYVQALTAPGRYSADDKDAVRAAALTWLHNLGLEADRLTSSF
jgi:hypothetical protein